MLWNLQMWKVDHLSEDLHICNKRLLSLITIFNKFFEDICREKNIISKYKKSSYHWTLHWAWRGPALQGPDVQPRARRTARNQQPWDMLSEDASAEDSSSPDRVVWGQVWRTALTWESWAFLKNKHPQFNYLQREREAAATGPLGWGHTSLPVHSSRAGRPGSGSVSVGSGWGRFDGWNKKTWIYQDEWWW